MITIECMGGRYNCTCWYTYVHILCIALRYNKPNKPENHNFFNKISASVLSLGFRYFELRNIYKQILNRIRIPIFSSEIIHRQCNESCTIYIVRFSQSIEQQKQFYNYKANDLGVVQQTNHLHVYRRFLTNRLHDKAAKLCLANS